MSHSVNISLVTSIRLGNTFRGKIEGSVYGKLAVIQPKNIANKVLKEEPVYVDEEQITSLDRHLLQSGDILLSNKGLKFASILYEGMPGLAIASSSFFVLSPNKNMILPEYLLWYLNQKSTLDNLLKLVSGSTIPSLSKTAFERFTLPLPELEVQKRIVEMVQAVKAERIELENLIEKRQEYQDAYCWELIMTNL